MDERIQPIRVLVADDHTLFRDGLQSLLGSVSDVEVVGEAGNGKEAIAAAFEFEPDVILMDILMPVVSGIEATKKITATLPDVGVVMLTMYDDDDSVFAAMRAGARGYILKGADQSEMLRAIRSVASGEALFGPSIATLLLQWFSGKADQPPDPFPELSEREREILELIASGRSNPAIATELYISPKTVRNHVSSIFSKLHVSGRSEAIVRARNAGLGD